MMTDLNREKQSLHLNQKTENDYNSHPICQPTWKPASCTLVAGGPMPPQATKSLGEKHVISTSHGKYAFFLIQHR